MMQVAIYGRLGIDPEARTTRNDKPMATASIAVDAKLDSSDRQETIWLSVLALEKLAEAILRHQQGDLVSLAAKVTMSLWTGQDEQEGEQLSIIAHSLMSVRTVRTAGSKRRNQGN